MAPILELLQHRGYVEGEIGKGQPSVSSSGERGLTNQPELAAARNAAGSPPLAETTTPKARAAPMSGADVAREAEKRQRKQEAKAAEEATKRREEGKKQSEQTRKESKRRAAPPGQAPKEEVQEVDGGRSVNMGVEADGTAIEL